MVNKVTDNIISFVKPFIELNKVPSIWISDIPHYQNDNNWKEKYEDFYTLKMQYGIAKQSFTEILKFWWLMYLFPSINNLAKNGLKSNKLIFSSQNDKAKPDIFIYREWYEFTFSSLYYYRDIKKKTFRVMEIGQQEIENHVIPSIIQTIQKKSQKNYNVEENINLVIFLPHYIVKKIILKDNFFSHLTKYDQEIIIDSLHKFERIFICTEDISESHERIAKGYFIQNNNGLSENINVRSFNLTDIVK